MNCIYCGWGDTKVIDKRDSDGGDFSRRRRECVKCTKRFTTYERPEKVEVCVVKKDGSKQEFDREKLEKSLVRACSKNIAADVIQDIVDEIEMRLANRNSKEVSSSDIGRMALTRLKKLDKVSYMRFASVFLDFESVEDFQKEIQKIK